MNSRTKRKMRAGFKGNGTPSSWQKTTPFGDYKDPNQTYKFEGEPNKNSIRNKSILIEARAVTDVYSKRIGTKPLSMLRDKIRRSNITTYNNLKV